MFMGSHILFNIECDFKPGSELFSQQCKGSDFGQKNYFNAKMYTRNTDIFYGSPWTVTSTIWTDTVKEWTFLSSDVCEQHFGIFVSVQQITVLVFTKPTKCLLCGINDVLKV